MTLEKSNEKSLMPLMVTSMAVMAPLLFILGIVGDAYNSKLNLTKGFVFSVAAVPEPESYFLFLAGLGLIARVHKRSKYS